MLEFFVPGLPETKGSTTPFIDQRTGRLGTKSNNRRLASWERSVVLVARGACAKAGIQVSDRPVAIELEFRLPRPAAHFVANDRTRPLKRSAPRWHATKREDLDKLQRAVLDGLTKAKLLWDDDGRVARIVASKRWRNHAEESGVLVRVRLLEEAELAEELAPLQGAGI